MADTMRVRLLGVGDDTEYTLTSDDANRLEADWKAARIGNDRRAEGYAATYSAGGGLFHRIELLVCLNDVAGLAIRDRVVAPPSGVDAEKP